MNKILFTDNWNIIISPSELAKSSGKPWNYFNITLKGKSAAGADVYISGDGVINYLLNSIVEIPQVFEHQEYYAFIYGKMIIYICKDGNDIPLPKLFTGDYGFLNE